MFLFTPKINHFWCKFSEILHDFSYLPGVFQNNENAPLASWCQTLMVNLDWTEYFTISRALFRVLDSDS